MLISGCMETANKFDVSSSSIKDFYLGDNYVLTCHIPKDAQENYYKLYENEKNGYSIRGISLANKLGKTDFYIYELNSGSRSLEYLFGDSKEAYKSSALEKWNKKQLISKGYDRDFSTDQSSSMKAMNGVKTDHVIRTIANDKKGNQMIVESCWFNYANAFWFMTTTWPKDYYDAWSTSDLLLKY